MKTFATLDRDPDPELLEIYLRSLNSIKAIEIIESEIRGLTIDLFSLPWYKFFKISSITSEISIRKETILKISSESIVRILSYLVKYIKENPGKDLPDLSFLRNFSKDIRS